MTPAVTDAMIEAGVRILDARRGAAGTFREDVRAIYTAMRSMEAKPDPEGDDVKWLRGFAWQLADTRKGAAARLELIADRLTAKPSLEPIQRALIRFRDTVPVTKREDGCPWCLSKDHWAGRLDLCSAPASRAICDVLARHHLGGSNG